MSCRGGVAKRKWGRRGGEEVKVRKKELGEVIVGTRGGHRAGGH